MTDEAPLTFRPLERPEIDMATSLLVECFGDSCKDSATLDIEASFSGYIYQPRTLVAVLDRKIVGLIQYLTAYFNPQTASMAWLAVDQHFRRRGIATRLMAEAERRAADEFFPTGEGTIIIVAGHDPEFYRRLGYTRSFKTHQNLELMGKIITS